jgi:protein TonB
LPGETYLWFRSNFPLSALKNAWNFAFALAVICVSTMPAHAQAAPAVSLSKTVEYFDAKHNLLPTAAGADYRVETTRRDSVTGSVRAYYASGQLKSVDVYGNLRHKIRHGVQTTWYETGQLHTKEDYLAGQRHGDLLVYYADGKVRRQDQYVRGQRTAGTCFAADGQPVGYFEYFQPPVYSEGAGDTNAIIHAMVDKGIYPEWVTLVGMDARIVVHFVVNERGLVEQVRAEGWKPTRTYPQYVLDGFRRLQTEAEWNVAHLKRFEPARLDGQPVPFGLTVPLSFRVLDK